MAVESVGCLDTFEYRPPKWSGLLLCSPLGNQRLYRCPAAEYMYAYWIKSQ